MQRSSVLVIAHEEAHRDAMVAHLLSAGCHVVSASTATLGIERAVVHLPDVVVVRPELPDGDSASIYREVLKRSEGGHVPVFVLAPDLCDVELDVPDFDHSGRLVDLAQFAQGISTLACSTNEMRLTACHVMSHGLHLDRQAFRATLESRELKLALTEFNILWQLARNAGVVLSRQNLCPDCHEETESRACRSIDVHVRSLRAKLGDHADLIETVRGVGYRFRDGVATTDRAVAAASCCD